MTNQLSRGGCLGTVIERDWADSPESANGCALETATPGVCTATGKTAGGSLSRCASLRTATGEWLGFMLQWQQDNCVWPVPQAIPVIADIPAMWQCPQQQQQAIGIAATWE